MLNVRIILSIYIFVRAALADYINAATPLFSIGAATLNKRLESSTTLQDDFSFRTQPIFSRHPFSIWFC